MQSSLKSPQNRVQRSRRPLPYRIKFLEFSEPSRRFARLIGARVLTLLCQHRAQFFDQRVRPAHWAMRIMTSTTSVLTRRVGQSSSIRREAVRASGGRLTKPSRQAYDRHGNRPLSPGSPPGSDFRSARLTDAPVLFVPPV
jgi:hypothetical protein